MPLETIGAPLPGKVLNINVNPGDSVSEGNEVCTLEAMKMENSLPSPAGGVIKEITCKVGDNVAKGDILCVIG